ncbi:hypothetical protein BH11PSE7_BH11PSE7_28460 [soil metagenome]
MDTSVNPYRPGANHFPRESPVYSFPKSSYKK